MGRDPQEALIRGRARPRHLALPPAVRAILWLDAVLLVAGLLALVGKPPALGHGASLWTWLALAGSTLTAASAALSAFELSERGRSRAWAWLPLPAAILWIGASGLGCFSLPQGADLWGDTTAEAGQCLKFLLAIAAPLLALILFMLWRVAPAMPVRVMALGGLASAAAAASLLWLVHPHDAALLDLGAHVIALAIVIGASTAVARLR
jgi:hypothetical protein